MPITTTELKMKYSGSTGTMADSKGGAISNTEVTSNQSENMFPNVTAAESLTGKTSYKCFYADNTDPLITLVNGRVFIPTNTVSTDDDVEVGAGTSAINGTEQTVANETTAPSGVTFTKPATYAAAVNLGNIPGGQHKAFWLKRVVSANAGPVTDDTFTVRIQGETS